MPLLGKRCAQCGDIDRLRFGRGVLEVFSYLVASAVAIGLGWWAIHMLCYNHAPISGIG